jgi:hypothetical protein
MKYSNSIVVITLLILLMSSCNSNDVKTFELTDNISIDNSKEIVRFLSENKQQIIHLKFTSDYFSGNYIHSPFNDNNEIIFLVKENIGFKTCEGAPLSKSQEEIASLCMDYTLNAYEEALKSVNRNNSSLDLRYEKQLIDGLEECADFFALESPYSFGLINLHIDNKEKNFFISESEGGWTLSGYFSVDEQYDENSSISFNLTSIPPVQIAKL